MSERIATCDTVLPLSQPITTIKGEVITEIPHQKGPVCNFSDFFLQPVSISRVT